MAGTARSQSTDPFQMNKFHVIDTEGYLNLGSPAAGFNSCTMPEVTVGIVEYIEGLWTYKRKYPGEPTFNPVTLTKGAVKNDTAFYKWIMAEIQHKPYRTNIIIKQYHRDDVSGMIDFSTAKAYKEIHLMNALVGRVKLGSDFDATSGEISIEEVDVDYESFKLFVNGTEIKA